MKSTQTARFNECINPCRLAQKECVTCNFIGQPPGSAPAYISPHCSTTTPHPSCLLGLRTPRRELTDRRVCIRTADSKLDLGRLSCSILPLCEIFVLHEL